MMKGIAKKKRVETSFTGIEAPFMTSFDEFPDYVGPIILLKAPIQREMVRMNEEGNREEYLQWLNAYSFYGFHVAFPWSKEFHGEFFTLKHLVYLYYTYLFWVDMYLRIRKTADSEGNRHEEFGFVSGYSKGERGTDTEGERLSKIICWHDEERGFRKFKRALSDLVGNRGYDKGPKNAETRPILRTGEIFDFFVSNAKNPEEAPNNDAIRTAIEQSSGRSGMSDEEIGKWMAFVSNFLAHIL